MAKSVNEMSSDELLEELLKLKLQEVQTLDPRSKEFKAAMEGISSLYKAQTESFKLNVESDYKRIEIEENRKKSLRDILPGIAGIAVPTLMYGILWNKGMKFEETGTYSSNGMRRLNNDMKLRLN